MNEIMLALEKDNSVSVVVLTGKGNIFAAGGSLDEFVALDAKKMLTYEQR